jgi:hypothetical protein
MTKKQHLKDLVATLQQAIVSGGMNREMVNAAIKALSELDHEYDYERFPTLVNTETFTDTSGDTPSNLAEALLWKLGKWKSYKRFAANYMDDNSKATKTDVVFFAFARHLKDKNNPIYDQHAIRALWAICGKLTDDERAKCKSLLFDGQGKWKQAGSGGDTIECYELFVRHISDLVSIRNGVSKGEIDRLLMPLGQAIKKSTKTYAEFRSLCGWSSNG